MNLTPEAIKILLAAGVTPDEWARANYAESGIWSGDSCGCPDSRCADPRWHHSPGQRCGCLDVLLESYLAGEGMTAIRHAGYRPPCTAPVDDEEEGPHDCGKPSRFIVARSDLDDSYGSGGGTDEACEDHLADSVAGMLEGDPSLHAVVLVRWDEGRSEP